jgi:hypothetical protein
MQHRLRHAIVEQWQELVPGFGPERRAVLGLQVIRDAALQPPDL